MDLLDAGADGAAIDELARGFGLSRQQAEAVLGGVVPEFARRIERNTLSRGGVADLIGIAGATGASGPMAAIGSDAGRDEGNALLEQIFGTRDQSRAVAARASLSSGIGASIIQAMLPYIASMVMRAISRKLSGGLGDVMAKIPNLGGGPAPMGGGRIQMPAPFPTGGGGSMLPGPEGMQAPGRYGGNPYGDLSDIVRRGGTGASVDGNPLWRVLRNLLGGLLGFQSRGLVSWIVRMVVMRFGWSILRTVLRRMFTGR